MLDYPLHLIYSTNGIIKMIIITFVIDNGGDPHLDFTAQTNNTAVAMLRKLAFNKS